jgi:hypothetical protein
MVAGPKQAPETLLKKAACLVWITKASSLAWLLNLQVPTKFNQKDRLH